MSFGALVEHYKWSLKFLQENLFAVRYPKLQLQLTDAEHGILCF